jgi:hypothetical protein
MATDQPTLFDERWQPVTGYEGLYSASSEGRIRREAGSRRCRRTRVLTPDHDSNGYPSLRLCRDGRTVHYLVHRLVLEAFVGPRPEGMECLHRNGIKTDNRLANLCWGSHAENGADAVRLGEMARGNCNGMAKLTVEAVLAIRQRFEAGTSAMALAHAYDIHPETVRKIVKRLRWVHV